MSRNRTLLCDLPPNSALPHFNKTPSAAESSNAYRKHSDFLPRCFAPRNDPYLPRIDFLFLFFVQIAYALGTTPGSGVRGKHHGAAFHRRSPLRTILHFTIKLTVRWKLRARSTSRMSISHHMMTFQPPYPRAKRRRQAMKTQAVQWSGERVASSALSAQR